MKAHSPSAIVRPAIRPPIEPLEARIAPATIFLQPNGTLTPAVNDAAAATTAGADLAVRLVAGDTLIYDANSSGTFDPGASGDLTLAFITAGRVTLFFDDGADAGTTLQSHEATGLAVTDGIKGTIHTDINGDVATVLDATGAFLPAAGNVAIPLASIDGLTIHGCVLRSVYAGEKIDGLSIGNGIHSNGESVDSVRTGAATDNKTLAFNNAAATSFTSDFTALPAHPAADIKGLTLLNGGFQIQAGRGADATLAGNGGPGGSILGAMIFDASNNLALFTGSGGAANVAGQGGGMSSSQITLENAAANVFEITLGDGGAGAGAAGGNGGGFAGSTFTVLSDISALRLSAGNGGTGDGAGNGGLGGAVASNVITVTGNVGDVSGGTLTDGDLTVLAGSGGMAAGSGSGGAGGGITKTRFEALATSTSTTTGFLGFFEVKAGNGGNATNLTTGAKGGAGGALTDNGFEIHSRLGVFQTTGATFAGSASIEAGRGGSGRLGGGAGGALTGDSFSFTGPVQFPGVVTLRIASGEGGTNTGTAGGAGGGAGGPIKNLSLLVGAASDEVISVLGGDGGSSSANTGPGANGGVVEAVNVRTFGDFTGQLQIHGGDGSGAGSAGNGKGGAGGPMAKVQLDLQSVGGMDVEMLAGAGGIGRGTGDGGVGGAISKVTATISGEAGDLFIEAGGGDNGVKGGNGGAISNLSTTVTGALGTFEMRAGRGGDGFNAGAAGNGGNVSGVTLQSPGATGTLEVSQANGGDGGATGAGGNGGGIQKMKAFGNLDVIDLSAGDAGGNLFGLTLQNFAQVANGVVLRGGDGRNADLNGAGGDGGTVNGLAVRDVFGVASATAWIDIVGGHAGDGGSTSGQGGNSPAVSALTFDGPGTDFIVGHGNFAGSGRDGGGDAGAISGITGRVGTLFVEADNGGGSLVAGQPAGPGGSVSAINVEATRFVRSIQAGDGGNALALADRGAGGSITNVLVTGTGDIGDFASNFGLTSAAAGMGGLIAGQGGNVANLVDTTQNGTIANITATRIAAILAGEQSADTLETDNAVRSIANIAALVIGADVNHNRVFDFTNVAPAGFNLGDGDTALDGPVLVQTGGLVTPLPVSPLKLILV